jgi:hypothetical protein
LERKGLLFLGVLASLIDGFTFPTLGVALAKIISAELQYSLNPDHFGRQTQIWYFVALGIAFTSAIANSSAQWFFGQLSKDTVSRLRM